MSNSNNFGRDDFTTLLSTDVFSDKRQQQKSSSFNKDIKNDVKSDQNKNTKQKQQQKVLYRSKPKKLLQHHLLAIEDEEQELEKNKQDLEREAEEEYDDNGFLKKKKKNKILQPQRKKKEAIIIQKTSHLQKRKRIESESDEEIQYPIQPQQKNPPSVPSNTELKAEESSESDSASESSDSSSVSSSSSSSEEQAPILMTKKPLFISKSKRMNMLSEEQQEAERIKQQQKQKEQQEKRALESRALVAQVISMEQEKLTKQSDKATDYEADNGATNARPDDTDHDSEQQQMQQDWTVRELLRILHHFDQEQRIQQEQEEYAARQKMTDEEIMKLQPQTQQHDETEEKDGYHLQRFYHRGAYYMDEDDLDEDDVRRKAKEYSRSLTGSDKIDKSMLPKVMQVKNFGKKGYSTKYKGLKQEDTSERNASFIPHLSVQKKKQK